MIRVLVETRVVYRSEVGRRGRLTAKAAYLDAAWEAWRAKYPTNESRVDAIGQWDSQAADDDEADREYRRRVIGRLARWLRWRDSVTGATPAGSLEAAVAIIRRTRGADVAKVVEDALGVRT